MMNNQNILKHMQICGFADKIDTFFLEVGDEIMRVCHKLFVRNLNLIYSSARIVVWKNNVNISII